MALALTLALRLITAVPDECYLVTNTRILLVPCDIGPSTIDELTEEPPASSARAVPPQRRVGPAARRSRTSVRARPAPPLATQELERRLQAAQEERLMAVAERVAAERARDDASAERDAAVRELARVRKALAAARARLEQERRTASR